MSLFKVSAGNDLPHDVNVIIEIPKNSAPIKYEVDKDTGALHVDRFMATSMFYPCDYGYIPNTLSEDGDPLDVLVVCPHALIPGSVIRCRVIGMLRMTDESGPDAKLLALPVSKLTSLYDHIEKPEDLGMHLLNSIEHFFSHYKDLEKGKWVKVDGWEGVESAHKEIDESVARHHSDVES